MIILTAAAVAALLPIVSAQVGNSRKEAADWPMYNRDLNGTRYSPLTQINTRNVARLTRAWTYKVGKDYTSGITGGSEMTPIVVNGVMYLANAKKVLALEPETGKEIWNYELKNGNPTKRAVAFWPGDGTIPPRIFFTSDRKLIALGLAMPETAMGPHDRREREYRGYRLEGAARRDRRVATGQAENGPLQHGWSHRYSRRLGVHRRDQ